MTLLGGFTPRQPPERFIANYASTYKVGGAGAQAGTANRVHLTAMYTPRAFVPSSITVELTTGSAGANIRLGVYQAHDPLYENDTPHTAPLLYDSGNISAATSGLKEHGVATAFTIKAGMFWMALETEDATMAYRRLSATVASPAGEDIFGCFYDLGSFGALTNPCPTPSDDDTCNFVTLAMVDSSTWG